MRGLGDYVGKGIGIGICAGSERGAWRGLVRLRGLGMHLARNWVVRRERRRPRGLCCRLMTRWGGGGWARLGRWSRRLRWRLWFGLRGLSSWSAGLGVGLLSRRSRERWWRVGWRLGMWTTILLSGVVFRGWGFDRGGWLGRRDCRDHSRRIRGRRMSLLFGLGGRLGRGCWRR